jgi:hypothetical protein
MILAIVPIVHECRGRARNLGWPNVKSFAARAPQRTAKHSRFKLHKVPLETFQGRGEDDALFPPLSDGLVTHHLNAQLERDLVHNIGYSSNAVSCW